MASVLDFITTNPFNAAFDDATDAAADQRNKDAQRAVNEARLAEIISQAPLDTRTKKGNALRSEADATVAEGTVIDRIAQERNKAGYTEGQMIGEQQRNRQEATIFPEKMREQTNQANYAGNQASTELQRGQTEKYRTVKAGADADVAVQTVSPRVTKSVEEANLAGLRSVGQAQTNTTNYQMSPFKVQTAADTARKADVTADAAEIQRDTATSNKNIAAAKLEQEVFKIGASSGAGAARAFANQNGVDLSPEALSSLNNKVYMAEMKGVMDQLEARMPGDANIMARDAALDQISPIILDAATRNVPIDYAAIEAIISPVTPAVPAAKVGGGGKIWTMPDVMKEARTAATALAKGQFGGIDQELYNTIYKEKIKEFEPYIGTTGVPPPASGTGQGAVRRLNPGEFIQNADGTQSTERTITVMNPRLNGGRPTNIPSIWNVDGKVVELPFGQPGTEDQAVEFALRTGEQFQSFNSIPEAEAAAQARSAAGGRFQDAAPSAAPAAAAPAPAAAPAAVPNQQAINFLKTNATPEMRKYFDLKFGVGAAAKVLGN